MSNVKDKKKVRTAKRIVLTKKSRPKIPTRKRPQPKKPETKTNPEKIIKTPDVIVDFELENGLLSIIIENIGDDAAHDTEIKFNKKIFGMQKTKNISSLDIFKNLKFLPPGKRVKVFVDSFVLYVANKQPMQIRVSIMFKNNTKQRFENSIQHDLTIYKDITEIYETRDNLS